MNSSIDNLSVAIILVNWNGWEDCIECLASIQSLNHKNLRTFIVDNASTNRSLERIAEWCKSPTSLRTSINRVGAEAVESQVLRGGISSAELSFCDCEKQSACLSDTEVFLIHSGANRGFAGGNNVGIKCAGIDKFDFFWLLNTDTVVDCQALDALLERAVLNSTLGIVGSTLAYYYRPEYVQALGGGSFDRVNMRPMHIGEGSRLDQIQNDPATVEESLAYVVGASMLVRSSFLMDVGLMAEDYFLYFEEIDWAVRAFGKYKMGYAPASIVYHKVGGSSARIASFASARMQYLSRLKFVARYFSNCYPRLIWKMLFNELPKHLFRRRGNQSKALLAALVLAGKAYRQGIEGRSDIFDLGKNSGLLHQWAKTGRPV